MEYLIIWKYHDTHVEHFNSWDSAERRVYNLCVEYGGYNDFSISTYQARKITM